MACNKDINLTLTDVKGETIELKFGMNLAVYDEYMNTLGSGKKLITASKKLLNSAVKNESRPKLRQLMQLPGVPVDLSSEIIEMYKPEFDIAVKISSDEPTESEETVLKA